MHLAKLSVAQERLRCQNHSWAACYAPAVLQSWPGQPAGLRLVCVCRSFSEAEAWRAQFATL